MTSLRLAPQHLPAGTGSPFCFPTAFGWHRRFWPVLADHKQCNRFNPHRNGPIPNVMHLIPAQISHLALTHLMVVTLNKMLTYLNNSQRKVQIYLQDLCLMQSGSKPEEKEVIILSYTAF